MKLEIKKSLFLALTLTVTLAATFMSTKQAEAALSILSRANCTSLNESVTWDPWAYYTLKTQSYHYYNGIYRHMIDTGWRITGRSYAGHGLEGYGGWYVSGSHWRWSNSIGIYWLGGTSASGCNLSRW